MYNFWSSTVYICSNFSLTPIYQGFVWERIYKLILCFWKVGKNKILFLKLSFLFRPTALIVFVSLKKNNIFLRFCLCIFESDTFKSECPVQIFRKVMKNLKI